MSHSAAKGRQSAAGGPSAAVQAKGKGREAKPAENASKALEVLTLREEDWIGKSEARIRAEVAISSTATGAAMARLFARGSAAGTDLTETVGVIQDRVAAVKANNLSGSDEMLTAQVATLDAIFYNLASKAAAHLGSNLTVGEIYMRLALKTQAQCRATWETIAAIKNPPVVYAKQANFSGGGPQQVNNSVARAESQTRQTKQLEERDGEWMDAREAREAIRNDPWLATVGAIDRASNAGRKETSQPEFVSRLDQARSESDESRTSKAPAGLRRAVGSHR